MDNVLVVVFCLLLVVLAAYGSYLVGRAVQKEKCRHHTMYEMSEQLDEAVDTVLRMEEKLALVKSLQYEKACKEDLMEVVKQMFFFRYFKNPKDVYKELEEKMKEAAEATCFVKENQVVAEMYRTLLDNIRNSWLEPEQF